MKKILLLLIILNFAYSQPKEITIFQQFNLDFEIGNLGEMPVGWHITPSSKERGYKAQLTDVKPYKGKYCLELSNEGIYKEGIYGSVMQSIDAKPYQGKRVKLRAAVRAEITSERGSAHIWIREHFIDGAEGKFEYMEERPIVSNQWAIYELEMDIEKFTGVINYGLLLFGTGKAWIDNVSLDVVFLDPTQNEPPKEITNLQIDNLAAFADIFGYVRYFHPSKEAQSANWDEFALLGVQEIENVNNIAELKNNLEKLFTIVAPGIKIYAKSEKSEYTRFAKEPKNALKNVSISWIQDFGGLELKDPRIKSKVVNVYESQREKPGIVLQSIEGYPLRNMKMVLSVWAKANLVGVESKGQIWISIFDENKELIKTIASENNPITENRWKKYTLTTEVPDNAEDIRIGLVLIGDGLLWFDDVIVEVYDSKKLFDTLKPKNYDFEIGIPDEIVRNWIMPQYSKNAGYKAINTTHNPKSGKQCLLIQSDIDSRVKLPEPGEIIRANAGNDLIFDLQISLFLDSLRTLPYPPKDFVPPKLKKGDDFVLNPQDRQSRLATVIIMWNFFRHFSLMEIEQKKLYSILRKALYKASLDKNEREFLETLRILTTLINDSQAKVWYERDWDQYGFPILWRYVDNKVLVTKVGDDISNLAPGDEVIEFMGKNIHDTLSVLASIVSGANIEWKKLKSLAMLRAGNLGSIVKLKVKKTNGETINVELERNTHIAMFIEDRYPEFIEISPGVYYIDMMRVDDTRLKDSLDNLIKNAKAIIFDARGISNISEHFLGLLVDENLPAFTWKIPRFTKPDRGLINYRVINSQINKNPRRLKSKLYFLTDERTIGYSEAIVALIKHYKLGEIIGTKTAGSPGDIIVYRLPCKYYLSVTGLKLFMPDNTLVTGNGIEPTIKVEWTREALIKNEDPLIYKAIEEIAKKGIN